MCPIVPIGTDPASVFVLVTDLAKGVAREIAECAAFVSSEFVALGTNCAGVVHCALFTELDTLNTLPFVLAHAQPHRALLAFVNIIIAFKAILHLAPLTFAFIESIPTFT